MARFKVTGPDGKNYAIEAPDATVAAKEADAFFAVKNKPEDSKPSLSAGETALDAGISAGSGVTKGTLDLGTMPADIATAGAGLARKIGVPENAIDTIKQAVKYSPDPLSVAVKASQGVRDFRKSDNPIAKGLKAYESYQPQSTVGKYAKTVGEFAPGAIGGGEGAALRFAKYALAPGLASEGLGQLTEGTKLEPYARGAGALLGLGTGAALLNPAAEARAVSRLPSAQHFEDTANAAYDVLDNSGIYIKHTSMDRMLQGLTDHLADIGYVPGEHTKAAARLGKIENDLRTGRFGSRPLSFREADSFSKSISNSIKDLDATDRGNRRILWAAKHYVDDFLQGQTSTAGGRTVPGLHNADIYQGGNYNLPEVQGAIRNARANWAAKSKSELLDQMVQAGEDTGRAVYTRGGVEHGTRREFLKFIRKNPNKRQSLTADEVNSFRNVARGGRLGNLYRGVGKLANSLPGALTYGTLGGGAAGALLGGPVGTAVGLGIPLAGVAARIASKRATMKALSEAQSLIRNGRRMRRPFNSILGKLNTLNEARLQ